MWLSTLAIFAVATHGAAVVHPEVWPGVPQPIARDAGLEARVAALLTDMTLEQKVGQLIQADIGRIEPDDLRLFPLGSILNGGDSAPGNDEFASPRKWLALADRFYAASMDRDVRPHPIPVLWATDAVHGPNKLPGATLFPHNIGLGAARDPDLVRQIGVATAQEMRVVGLDWTFGPSLPVVRDVRWGRTYESYSSDPMLVARYAAAIVAGLQGPAGSRAFLDSSHVLATAKHFVGDGGTQGRDQGDNPAGEAELRDYDGAGYPAAIGAGVQAVMASFSSWQGVKVHGLPGLLTGVLRDRMHFDGLLIGDWNGHDQVPGCSRTSCAAAINAGIDVLMAPDSWRELYSNTLAQARSGEIPLRRVDEAVRRILRVKMRAHLFDEGPPSSRPLAGRFDLLGSAEHRALARRAVRESLVLLKNQSHLLPLSPRTRVLVAGDGADNIAKQSGGWTLTWQGTGLNNRDFPHGQSIYAGIEAAVRAAGGVAQLSRSGQANPRPDVAIVVFGEDPYAESQGDIQSVAYRPNDARDLRLLQSLKAQGLPVVAVFLSGRPLWVNAYLNTADAFVAAWLPGTEGGGIADVLFRSPNGRTKHDFRGKLSFAWPRTPQAARPDSDALFPVGYGLTYADNGDLQSLPEGSTMAQAHARSVTVPMALFEAGRLQEGLRWKVAPDVRATPIDRVRQEDALRVQWHGGAGPAQLVLLSDGALPFPGDLREVAALTFDCRTVAGEVRDLTVGMQCGPGCEARVSVANQMNAAPAGGWHPIRVPVKDLAATGANLERITAPFVLEGRGPLTLDVSNICLESVASQPACP